MIIWPKFEVFFVLIDGTGMYNVYGQYLFTTYIQSIFTNVFLWQQDLSGNKQNLPGYYFKMFEQPKGFKIAFS